MESFECNEFVMLAAAGGGNHVASVSTDGALKLWDYGMGGISRSPIREYHEGEEAIHFIDADPLLHTILTGGKESQR